MNRLPSRSSFSDATCSTVKAFAAKGMLIPKSDLENLAQSVDLDDLVARLKGTSYSHTVSKLSKPYSATKLEFAFRQSLALFQFEIIKVTPNPDLLQAYYMKHITRNLKTILKGRVLGRSFEELSSHIDLYAEELLRRRDLIVKVLSATNVPEAVAMLEDSEFFTEAEAAWRAYQSIKNIQVFDVYLDGAYYRGLLEAYSRGARVRRPEMLRREFIGVRSLLGVDIDAYNFLALLRAKLWGLPASETLQLVVEPAFDISKRFLKKTIYMESVSDAVKLLVHTPYRPILKLGRSDEETISLLEEAFETLGYRRAAKSFLWSVFGQDVALGMVKLKELEVRNLSAVAFGIEQHTAYQDIISKLVTLA